MRRKISRSPWETVYFKFMPDFADKYGASVVENLRKSGATQAEVQAKIEEMKNFKVMYDKPLINAAYTFIDPFPVGLVITLISAAALRKKADPQPVRSATTA